MRRPASAGLREVDAAGFVELAAERPNIAHGDTVLAKVPALSCYEVMMKLKACPSCGHETAANPAQCSHCGKRLRMSLTKAVVSFVLLAAGVVGVRYAFTTINHAAESPNAHPAGAEEVRAKEGSSTKGR